MIAVDEIDVGMTWRSEQDVVACRASRRRMGSGIAFAEIGFHFNDAGFEQLGAFTTYQDFAQQLARDTLGIAIVEIALQSL